MLTRVVFEQTFAPEIEIFSPPQPVRDVNSSIPSPTWRKASPVNESSPIKQQADGNAYVTGAGVVEEAAAVQPISFKQRGTRLSFLGGRRKESRESNGEGVVGLHEADSNTTPNSHPGSQRSTGKENRRSFFRGPSSHETIISAKGYNHSESTDNSGPDWVHDAPPKSSERVGVAEKNPEHGAHNSTPRLGSVRKRLSLLKLGGSKRGKPNGFISGVEEE